MPFGNFYEDVICPAPPAPIQIPPVENPGSTPDNLQQ